MTPRRAAWPLLACLLLGVPLRAQDAAPAPPAPAAEAPAEATPPAAPPAAADDAASEAEAPAEDEGAPEERVSADNNLSFPVDI